MQRITCRIHRVAESSKQSCGFLKSVRKINVILKSSPNAHLATSAPSARRWRVLMIEDDPQIAGLVSSSLREALFEVECFSDGELGLAAFDGSPPDLLLLDLSLPNLDGLEVCRRIREKDRRTPVFMLTARAAKSDIVAGLELGADEYLTKPFDMPELVARMRALLRRVASDREENTSAPLMETLQRGALRIGVDSHEVHLGESLVALTAKEFELLLLFARNPGRTFSRSELLTRIWGSDFEGFEHTVNTHINRLRGKIEPQCSQPVYIQTVWGSGYRFATSHM